MNYLFRNEWCDVPAYTAYPACRLVKIEYTIVLAPVAPRDQRTIKPDWRKVWQFARAEGVFNTGKKIQSKREQAYLTSDFHVVLAVGIESRVRESVESRESRGTAMTLDSQDSLTPLLCLGTRHPRAAEVMLFREDLTHPLVSLPPADLCLQVIEELHAAFDTASATWQEISGYNFYSDLDTPDAARYLLCSAATRINERLSAQPSHGKPLSQNFRESARVIYPATAAPSDERSRQHHTLTKEPSGELGAVVIAAGDYVRTVVVPALQKQNVKLHTVVDLEPYRAEYVRRKCGFRFAMTDWRKAIAQPDIGIVIIASYHDSHAEIAEAALRAGKKTFVEKPPVVTHEDLTRLMEAGSLPGAFLEIGYNRRYIPFSRRTRELLQDASGPTTITCLVKEVEIPDLHWYRWPKEGTRVTGNICHWIDLSIYLLGTERHAVEMTLSPPADRHPDEERSLHILFDDGSYVTIIATGRGDSTLGVQEWIEVRRADLTVRIDDYRRIIATRGGRTLYRARSQRDKGHGTMYREAIARMKSNKTANYTLRELRRSALLTIHATEMVTNDVRHMMLDV